MVWMVCFAGESLDIEIELTNFGTETLTSVDITIDLNNGADVEVVSWTGSLAMDQSETITYTLGPLMDGANTVTATTSVPNGQVDEIMANDGFQRDFDVILEGQTITLELSLDQFPDETSWEIADETGNVLVSGGGYTQAGLTLIEQFCLPEK